MTKKTPPSKPFISSWRAVIATLGADATHEQSPDETPNADDAQTHLATADQVTRGPHSLAADDGQLPTPDTYALVLTHEQRQAARAAFELYARLGMGQLDYVADLLRAGLVVYNSEPQETPTQRARRTEDFEDCLLRLKKQFSGHAPTAYYSIHSPTVNSSCRAAWDMHKLLSHQFEKERGLTGWSRAACTEAPGKERVVRHFPERRTTARGQRSVQRDRYRGRRPCKRCNGRTSRAALRYG